MSISLGSLSNLGYSSVKGTVPSTAYATATIPPSAIIGGLSNTQWTTNTSNVYIIGSNVSIGKSNSIYALDVVGDINFAGALRSNGVVYGGGTSQFTTSGSNVYIIGSNIGFGTSTPSGPLDVNGDIYSSGRIQSRPFNQVQRTVNISFPCGSSSSSRWYKLATTTNNNGGASNKGSITINGSLHGNNSGGMTFSAVVWYSTQSGEVHYSSIVNQSGNYNFFELDLFDIMIYVADNNNLTIYCKIKNQNWMSMSLDVTATLFYLCSGTLFNNSFYDIDYTTGDIVATDTQTWTGRTLQSGFTPVSVRSTATFKSFTYSSAVGRLGLNVRNPQYQLHLNTDTAAKSATSTWTVTSDQRVKEEIVNADLDRCYEVVKQLPLRRFKWSSNALANVSDAHMLGWIAQEVQPFIPNAIHVTSNYGLDDALGLDTDQIIKFMYGSIQRIMAYNDDLKNRINVLEGLLGVTNCNVI